MSDLLRISDLALQFGQQADARRVVDGVSLHLRQGEILGLVGESGSGKSLTALSVMGLLPSAAQVVGGSILYGSEAPSAELLNCSPKDWQHIRGREIAMIFQEPMSSLNPVFRCGEQVAEALRWHFNLSPEEARDRTLQWFRRVQMGDAERIYQSYPHQVSGGQKQRVMIAMALCCQPRILIADEPTTALDVTVQQAILQLLRQLHEEENLSTLFISHDLGVVGAFCHRVAVMRQGQVVEEGPVQQILRQPRHPYTQRLLHARPSLRHQYHRLAAGPALDANSSLIASHIVSVAETTQRREALYAHLPLLRAEALSVRFPAQKNWLGMPAAWLQAVDQVSFEVYAGETFGIAGESGCGKTTLGRALACLQPVNSGAVYYSPAGVPALDLLRLQEHDLRLLRRQIQVIFQDAQGALDPRMSIGTAIAEPMAVHGIEPSAARRRERTAALLEMVGLEADLASRLPYALSGGQRQRACIARALAVQPRVLICDECVSSLDVSVQAMVLNLLKDLQEKLGLTYLFISHDLSVIRQMCDRLMVMQSGRVVALGYPEDVLDAPSHPLVSSMVHAVPGV